MSYLPRENFLGWRYERLSSEFGTVLSSNSDDQVTVRIVSKQGQKIQWQRQPSEMDRNGNECLFNLMYSLRT